MLIIRGINVYPREIEAVLLEDPDLSGQYAIVVDRRATMAELRVRAESNPGVTDRTGEVGSRLEAALLARVRVRVQMEVVAPSSMARTEVGKVQRVFEQTDDRDPLG
jgi:phenylacetate-CoA ligase